MKWNDVFNKHGACSSSSCYDLMEIVLTLHECHLSDSFISDWCMLLRFSFFFHNSVPTNSILGFFFFEKMFTASALPAFKVYLPNFQTTHIMFPSLTIFQMLSICAFKSDSTQCRKLPSLYNIRTNRLIYVARDVPKLRRARRK